MRTRIIGSLTVALFTLFGQAHHLVSVFAQTGETAALRTAGTEARTSAVTTSATSLFRPFELFPLDPRVSFPTGLAIGDLNHDGLNDIAVVTAHQFGDLNNSLLVFLQGGEGRLRTPTAYPIVAVMNSVDVGDVNGDGRHDVVLGANDRILVMLQNAAGTLDGGVAYPTANSALTLIGDFNSDGRNAVAGS